MGETSDFFDNNSDLLPIVKKSAQNASDASEQDLSKDYVIRHLLEHNLITEHQLRSAIHLYKKSKQDRMFGEVLVEIGIITDKMLKKILHSFKGISEFELKNTILDGRLVDKVPRSFAIENKIIPIAQNDNVLYVAMYNVYDIMQAERIRRFFPSVQRVIPIYAKNSEILSAIDKYYGYELNVEAIIKEIGSSMSNDSEAIMNQPQGKYTHPIIRLLDAFFADAVKIGASDIHFEPCEFFLRVRYRIDGVLIQRYNLDTEVWDAMVVRIKIISGMDITEKRHTQDGRISISVSGRNIDMRVSTQPTIHGENCVMRILDASSATTKINKLGIDEFSLKLIQASLARPEGVVIVTGPTGSGKTTTLYSMLHQINTMEVNIMTMEDPVEYQMKLVRQSNIVHGTGGMDFEEGLRGIMRQDPDVIFLGEVRDKVTAQMAVRSAMTGHKVFTSLHTNDALSAIIRLKEMDIASPHISSTITGLVGQRLARKLCVFCKEKVTLTIEEKKLLNLDLTKDFIVYKSKTEGCPNCSAGYKGRILVLEAIFVDDTLRKMISKEATYEEMNQYLQESGSFISMKQCAIDKMLAGETDLEELSKTVNISDDLFRIIEKKPKKPA